MLRDYFTQDFFTCLILACLLILVVARRIFSSRFKDFLAVIYNLKYLKLYAREKTKFDIFNTLLFSNFILTTSIFCFLTINTITSETLELFYGLPLLILGLTILLITKSTLERVVGYFFEFSEIIKTYLFYKNTFKYISGLLLLFANILLLYSSLDKNPTIYVTIAVLILINLSGFLRFLKLYEKEWISNFFYFLLYLCALEIGPYVILYKVIKDYFG